MLTLRVPRKDCILASLLKRVTVYYILTRPYVGRFCDENDCVAAWTAEETCEKPKAALPVYRGSTGRRSQEQPGSFDQKSYIFLTHLFTRGLF